MLHSDPIRENVLFYHKEFYKKNQWYSRIFCGIIKEIQPQFRAAGGMACTAKQADPAERCKKGSGYERTFQYSRGS